MVSKTIFPSKMKSLFFILFLSFSHVLVAQNLVVSLESGASYSFSVTSVRSIRFDAEDMILRLKDGTSITWNISIIEQYTFDKLNSTDQQLLEKIDLQIFPNPSSGLVNIRFNASFEGDIKIDILDVQGKIIKSPYRGPHVDQNIYQWDSQVAPGIYYCRVTAKNQSITKPILIQ
jgi:hypothetical protein